MEVTRREFVQSMAAAGAAATLTQPLWAAAAPDRNEIPIGIIGAGSQGRNLLNNCLKIESPAKIRFLAICDIWSYHQDYSANILKRYDQPVTVYTDYQEFIDKEKGRLQAVIVATPDFMHAPITNACLKAGLHVYCEKEMANTLEAAASMVRTARETGKLLQIGHQRRSNPRYSHAIKLIEKDNVLGRITHVQGQWNRFKQLDIGWPAERAMTEDQLKKYGYASMDEFRNWRWYRKYSGGPMADLGSHQIDVFNWILKASPSAVMANGGLDYYTGKGRDWYDNVLAVYEWKTKAGPVRGFYQILNTTSFGGYFETFMGDGGTIQISEDPAIGQMFREQDVVKREWEDESVKIEKMGKDAITLKIGMTLTADGKKTAEGERLLAESQKPPHQLHLENFFNAVKDPRANKLSCPAEIGYESAVSVLTANDSIAAGKRIEIPESAYKV